LAIYNIEVGETIPSTGQVGVIFSGGTTFAHITDFYLDNTDADGATIDSIWNAMHALDYIVARKGVDRGHSGVFRIDNITDTGTQVRFEVSPMTASGSPGVDELFFWAVPVSGVTTLTKTITIKTPANDENATMFFTPSAITCTKCNSVVLGATSDATFNLYWNPEATRSNAGTAIHSGDIVAAVAGTDTALADGDTTVPADSWVFIKTSAITNAPTELHVTLTYTED
jgi:hypothetical protein